eukprot:TRINITY_DN4406_c0_g2_i1.p1 TRINITY_DN4406_c0_g2~~TRINITY_DN4406_c0_g2_i1.p1  ORF type:complete len:368 (-),score=75.46 TRINITY_DN4406_c0_g2_i1:316-1419(-)
MLLILTIPAAFLSLISIAAAQDAARSFEVETATRQRRSFSVGTGEAACLAAAEKQIVRAPDKDDLHVTTTWLFKRDIARYFCPRIPHRFTALELGVFRGHTTAVLASIFSQVIAMDREAEYLREAGQHNRDRSNIVYLEFDTYADDWHILRANRVDVALIDADHYYNKVRADAHHVLAHLAPTLKYIIFDDYGMEEGVRRTVDELLDAKALHDCEPVGRGKEGQAWWLESWGWVNHTEGIICQRGDGNYQDAAAEFADVAFLLYAQPSDPLMRASGVISMQEGGGVWGSIWGRGSWERMVFPAEPHKLQLRLSLPGMAPGGWYAVFNRPRTAFTLSAINDPTAEAKWFGMKADKVNQVFMTANELFD